MTFKAFCTIINSDLLSWIYYAMAKEKLELQEKVTKEYVDRQWRKCKKLAEEWHFLTKEGGNFLIDFKYNELFNRKECALYDYEHKKYKRLWRNRWGIYYLNYWTTWEKFDEQSDVISYEDALKVIESFFEKVEEIKKRNIEKEEKKTAKMLADTLSD